LEAEEARSLLAFLSLVEEVAALLRICLFVAEPVEHVLLFEQSLSVNRRLVVGALEIRWAF